MNEGDIPLAVYTAPGYQLAGDEFVVDSIIAEKRKGNSFEYLVKWQVVRLHIIIRRINCNVQWMVFGSQS